MKLRVLLSFLLVLALAGPASAQEAAITAYAAQLRAAWLKDGIAVRTGIGEDGVQNLAVLARGGYFPLSMRAKAGVPTVLRLYTNKTNDCGRAFTLPDWGKQAILPPKGVVEFALPAQKKGATLYGSCGMGMYTFEIRFE